MSTDKTQPAMTFAEWADSRGVIKEWPTRWWMSEAWDAALASRSTDLEEAQERIRSLEGGDVATGPSRDPDSRSAAPDECCIESVAHARWLPEDGRALYLRCHKHKRREKLAEDYYPAKSSAQPIEERCVAEIVDGSPCLNVRSRHCTQPHIGARTHPGASEPIDCTLCHHAFILAAQPTIPDPDKEVVPTEGQRPATGVTTAGLDIPPDTDPDLRSAATALLERLDEFGYPNDFSAR